MASTRTLQNQRLYDRSGPRFHARLAWTAFALAATLTPIMAQAALNIYLFDDNNGNLTIESRGTLQLGASSSTLVCQGAQSPARIFANANTLYQSECPTDQLAYAISLIDGSEPWGSNANSLDGSFSGSAFSLAGPALFATNLASNASISSTATFTGSIADLGLTGSGPRLLAKYQIDDTLDTISVFADTPLPPTPAAVPAPLPLFGTAAAFGWSRRLRRRISRTRPERRRYRCFSPTGSQATALKGPAIPSVPPLLLRRPLA